MRILSLHSGHDGAIAYIEDGVLRFSIENEKDSFPRYSRITAPLVMEALEAVDGFPDVVAMGGWHKRVGARRPGLGGRARRWPRRQRTPSPGHRSR